MLRFKAEHKTLQIGSIKVGGKPGLAPTVLVGSIFYNKHYVLKDELKGEFDREEAERLIKLQEEFSDRTGNPHMVDVVGSTAEALNRFVDFVSSVTEAPILLDGTTAAVRIRGLDHIEDCGLEDRVVYNSISPDFKREEIERIRDVGIKNAILLAFTAEFTSQAKIRGIRELLPVANDAGIENPLIDAAVVDIPSLGLACRVIYELTAELGLPVGAGVHNAIATWRGLKTKMGSQAKDSSMAAASAIAVASGASFVLYGPIESADSMFPAIAMVDAAFAQVAIEEGAMPDPKHPIFRIA